MPWITAYQPLDIAFKRGQGVYLYDQQDNPYLDALCGIAVTSLGHCHPAITQALQAQASELWHTSNLYHISLQERLAQRLCELTGMQQFFFANSGAEANETAIKLARLVGHQRHIAEPQIIVMQQAFHGRTLATLTASGSAKVQAGFDPLVPGFTRAPYNDIEALRTIAQNSNDVVAVMLEPIQGEGGIQVPDDAYLPQVRQLCDENNWLMILDEVQTGVGRTGALYAFQHYDFQPDVVTSAKALGNGIPIGVCMLHGSATDVFKPGQHGSTYGGNPLACATALAVLDTLVNDSLITKAASLGQQLQLELKQELAEFNEVLDIRGSGMMIGIELDRPCRQVMHAALKHKLLINVTADKVIRLLPPLIYSDDDVHELVQRLKLSLQDWLADAA